MKEILSDYKVFLVAALAVVMMIIFEWQQFKVLSYKLMLQAKTLAQETWVVDRLYALLPKFFTAFVTKAMLQTVVACLYHETKDYLDDGMMNDSI
jgi:hypothetical protein